MIDKSEEKPYDHNGELMVDSNGSKTKYMIVRGSEDAENFWDVAINVWQDGIKIKLLI